MTSRVNIATRDYLESRNRLSKEEKEGMKWMSITLVWKSKGLIELRGRAFSEREGREKVILKCFLRNHVRKPQER